MEELSKTAFPAVSTHPDLKRNDKPDTPDEEIAAPAPDILIGDEDEEEKKEGGDAAADVNIEP